MSVSDEIDSVFGLRRAFDMLGWAPMLDFVGRGVIIELDHAILVRILGVSNEGSSMEFSKDAVLFDHQYRLIDALIRLHYSPIRNDCTGDMVFRTPNMLILQHLLVYLYSFNVLPRLSNLNKVLCSDIYLLDKMLHGLQGVEGIPFSFVVLFQIRSTVRSNKRVKSLCFPLLLSKVFALCGVDVIGEDIVVSGPIDVLIEANLYRMGYVLVRGVWRKFVRHPLREGEIADSSIALVVVVDYEEEHSKATVSSAMPSTSAGAPVHPSQGSLVASALQRIKDIYTGLASRQDVMEA
ncbi:hypothetical protein FNV43_RR13345 [Rhamnella rubrinervis]|uniref:Uncharacterized protein n=1 Tax=Rhamnella rubrinervis TaxID=2594499 RepID=A0A8K0H122_9ROSA|nr:hypothetical protein FNV43_RR13345 [Rhamnella rubrinervis]